MNTVSILKILTIAGALIFAGQADAQSFGPTHQRQSAHAATGKMTPSVPDPEAWAMMGVGLTLVGALARRRLVKK